MLCGAGEHIGEVKDMMNGTNNVIFPGYIDAIKIITLLEASMACFAPYRNLQNFKHNIPNKIIDALAHGVPIVSGVDGEIRNLIETYEVGVSYRSEDELHIKLKQLMDDSALVTRLRDAALLCYNSGFDFNNVYAELCDNLEALVATCDTDIISEATDEKR